MFLLSPSSSISQVDCILHCEDEQYDTYSIARRRGGEEEYIAYSSTHILLLEIEYTAYSLTPHTCAGRDSLLAR